MRRSWSELGAADSKLLAPLALFVVGLVIVTSGCGDGRDAPRTLVDGSPARTLRVELEAVDRPIVASRVVERDVRAVAQGSRIASCLRDEWSERPAGIVVRRIGVLGESVTFSSRSDRSLQACDGTRSADLRALPWCGHSFGRLTGGRLHDPHLGLGGCRSEEGKHVAFAWVEPGPRTRYVVIDQAGFSEAYETAADLPVRVATTTRVDERRLRAVLEVSEHSADGRKLRSYELEASVSG